MLLASLERGLSAIGEAGGDVAAAEAIAAIIPDGDLSEEYIIPRGSVLH